MANYDELDDFENEMTMDDEDSLDYDDYEVDDIDEIHYSQYDDDDYENPDLDYDE